MCLRCHTLDDFKPDSGADLHPDTNRGGVTCPNPQVFGVIMLILLCPATANEKEQTGEPQTASFYSLKHGHTVFSAHILFSSYCFTTDSWGCWSHVWSREFLWDFVRVCVCGIARRESLLQTAGRFVSCAHSGYYSVINKLFEVVLMSPVRTLSSMLPAESRKFQSCRRRRPS